ncbi:exodeoxyribonuclease VII large subunit [Acidicapsa dinghuensis]|uniref:Exodeoxyribonuclease 7 large subunit n=1 Tax=Acidicapsa dinghuensis TaxID=2218256 RepID=A0ABW1EI57_9BACT|nr:exodeoxyribonuclease VII large subunit [Acidicapsa dinghuensis]
MRRRSEDTLLIDELREVTPKSPSTPQLNLLFEAPAAPEAEVPAHVTRRRERRTWLVHELVTEARELVEMELGDVWIEGEISNCRPASSGHLYFTLKDAEAQLPVVLFRRQAVLLRFRPEDGLQVRVRGKVSIYEQRGQLQLVTETMEPVGAGSLQVAFEQLRDKLKAEGLFDSERKRPLPAFPRCVAVITSPTGAVIRDFLNVVGRRHAALSVTVVPVSVQGESAPGEIETALKLANEPGIADVIVVARGGGSLEDLAAFNSERVARAIAASRLPVVSAVGHETDFTIADFVADLRAPTPSAAAELITSAQHKIEELVAELGNRLARAARFQLLQAQQRMLRASIAYAQQRVVALLHRMLQQLDDFSFRMETAIDTTLQEQLRHVAELAGDVMRHDPRQELGAARELLTKNRDRLEHVLDRGLSSVRFEWQSLDARLYRAAGITLNARRAEWMHVRGSLQALSPLAVLQRGYALVQDETGAVVRSAAQLKVGASVETRLGNGSFTSAVTATMVSTSTTNRRKKGKDTQA